MPPELTGPHLESFNTLADYANFVSMADALRRKIEEATGKECVGLPKYPFPEVWFASPEPFDTSKLKRTLVDEAIKPHGRSVFTGATYIHIGFREKFSHPDGSFRSGFRWGANREEDTMDMLRFELHRRNAIDDVTLAWGENPFDIFDEHCDAALYVYNLQDLDREDQTGYALGSVNNTEAFAARLRETGTFDWLHWAWITSGSTSPLFARLTKELIVKTQKVTRQPAAVALFVRDVFEEGFDKEDGKVLLPKELAALSVDKLTVLATEISQALAPYRSNSY